MPDSEWEKLEQDELIEALSDRLDGMDEEDFDLSALDEYFSALDDEAPLASEFDAVSGEKAFREKYKELFEGDRAAGPALQVLPAKRRPRGWRLAGRIAAVAAAACLCLALVCQGMGIDMFGFLAHWGRGEFTFETSDQPRTDNLRYGPFDTLAEALSANGTTVPMDPTWVPEPGGYFGALKTEVTVSREAQSDLFTADCRDEEGRGYTVEVRRYDSIPATRVDGLGDPEAIQYVVDGRSYFILQLKDELSVRWIHGSMEGSIIGDLDVETAQALVRSITEGSGGGYHAPDPDRTPPMGNDLRSLLEVMDLDPNLAPTWLPEGFTKSELNSGNGWKNVEMIHAVYDDAAHEKRFSVHLEWWEDPAEPVAPVFAREGGGAEEYEHNGVTFRILDDGDGLIVTWTAGRVSGYISGDLTGEEARHIIDSIPRWSTDRPQSEEPGYRPSDIVENHYDSMSDALAAYNLPASLAPDFIPGRFVLEEVTATELSAWTDITAAYFEGEELFRISVKVFADEETAGSGTTIIIKDDEPVEEYQHNGVTFYIMTNNDRRSVAWKSGLMEGMISGPITTEEAKQIIDSMG